MKTTGPFATILVSALIFLVLAFNTLAAEQTARWIGQANGLWADSANWDIGTFPRNVGNSVFDVMGSYRPGLWAAIPVCAAGAVLFATLGKYRDFGEIVTPASDPAAPDPEGGPSRVAAGA